MEVYSADLPSGVPSTAGVLSAPLNVPFAGSAPETIPLSQVSGNEGVFVESVVLSGPDAADFAFAAPAAEPFLIPVGSSRNLMVEYTGAAAGAEASLDITYSGGQSETVMLLPEPDALLSLLTGVMALAWLGRRSGNR